jgi:uncharacterized protein YjbJ (UPF0337 family)
MMRRARTISLLPMAEAATPGSKPAITKRDPDVPPRQERVRFEILSGRTKVNDQVPFVRACAVQKWIFVVQRLSREIHLRDQAVSLAGDLEMNMRWPYQVRARGIGAWLDRVDDLSRCARGLAGDGGQIRILIQRLDTSGRSILASPVVTAAGGAGAHGGRPTRPRWRRRASALEPRRPAVQTWIAEDIPTTRMLALARQGPSRADRELRHGLSLARPVARPPGTEEDTLNKDEIEGKWEKAKGYVKDKAGKATGDADLEAEGEAQRAGGEIQEKAGKLRRKVGETVKDIGDKIKD